MKRLLLPDPLATAAMPRPMFHRSGMFCKAFVVCLAALLTATVLQVARPSDAAAETLPGAPCGASAAGLSSLTLLGGTRFVGAATPGPGTTPTPAPQAVPTNPDWRQPATYAMHANTRSETGRVSVEPCRDGLVVLIRTPNGSTVSATDVSYNLDVGTYELAVRVADASTLTAGQTPIWTTYSIWITRVQADQPTPEPQIRQCSVEQVGLGQMSISDRPMSGTGPFTAEQAIDGSHVRTFNLNVASGGRVPFEWTLCRPGLESKWRYDFDSDGAWDSEGEWRATSSRTLTVGLPTSNAVFEVLVRVAGIPNHATYQFVLHRLTQAEIDIAHEAEVQRRLTAAGLDGWLLRVGCARAGPGDFVIADGEGSPLCENLEDPFHWLPAWRWARSAELWSYFEDEGGILSFFANAWSRAWRGSMDMVVNAMFWLSSLLWQVTLAILEAALHPIGYARQFYAGLGERIALLLSQALGVAGSGPSPDAVLWSLVAVLGMLVALWALYRKGPAEALRTIAGTMVPLALMALIVQGINANSVRGYVFQSETHPSSQPGTVRVEPAVFSPSWMFEGTMHLSGLVSAPLASAANGISEIEQRDAGMSYCDSYLAALEDIYSNSYAIQSNETLGAPSEAAIESRASIGKLVSRMWEQSYALTHGSAQFGSYRAARKGGCLNAERLAVDRRFDGGSGVSTLEIQAVWDHTCRLNDPFAAPLYGCDSARVYDVDAAQIAEARFRPRAHDDADVRTFYTLAMACDFVPAKGSAYYANSGLAASQWPNPPGLTQPLFNNGTFDDLSQVGGDARFGDGDQRPDERIVLWHDDGSGDRVPHVWVDRRWVTYGDDDVISADRCAAWMASDNLADWTDDDTDTPAGTGLGAGSVNLEGATSTISTASTLAYCRAGTPPTAFDQNYGGVHYRGTACQGSIADIGSSLDSVEAPDQRIDQYVTQAYISEIARRLGLVSPIVFVFHFDSTATILNPFSLFFIGDGWPSHDLASLPINRSSAALLRFAQVEAFRGTAPINPQTGVNQATRIVVGNPDEIVLAHPYLQDVGDATPSDAVVWQDKLATASYNNWGDDAFVATVPSASQASGTTATVFNIHGYNWAHRLLQGSLSLIAAIVYLVTLSGLGVGLIVANLILAGIYSVLPLLLLAMAIPHPSARKLPRKVFRLLVGAMLSAATFLLLLSFVILFTAVLAKAIDSVGSRGSWDWLRALLLASVPVLAIFLVKGLGNQFGFKNLTSLKGAMAATSGMAIAAMDPPNPHPYAYARRKYRGVRRMNRGVDTAAGVLGGATGAGAANAARQRMTPLRAADGMTSGPASAFGAGAALGASTGGMFSDAASGGGGGEGVPGGGGGGAVPALGSDSSRFGYGSLRDQGQQLRDRLAGIGNTFRGTGDEGKMGRVGNFVRGAGQTAGLGAGLAAGAGRLVRRHKKKVFAGMLLTGMLPALLPSGAILPALAAGKIGARVVRPVTERTGITRTKSQRQQEAAAARQAGRDRLSRVFHTPAADPASEGYATLSDQGVTDLSGEPSSEPARLGVDAYEAQREAYETQLEELERLRDQKAEQESALASGKTAYVDAVQGSKNPGHIDDGTMDRARRTIKEARAGLKETEQRQATLMADLQQFVARPR